MSAEWETVYDVAAADRVRRIAVPGGWLYQTEVSFAHESGAHGEAPQYTTGWSAPVFVAAVDSAVAIALIAAANRVHDATLASIAELATAAAGDVTEDEPR